MEKLKPCPFCGGAVSVCYVSIFKAFVFTHKDEFADCMFPELVAYFDDYDISSLEHAAAAWNRRANNE